MYSYIFISIGWGKGFTCLPSDTIYVHVGPRRIKYLCTCITTDRDLHAVLLPYL